MRPPYGSHNAAVKATLESIGYINVLWNLVSADCALLKCDVFVHLSFSFVGSACTPTSPLFLPLQDSLDSAGATFPQEQVQYNTAPYGGSGNIILNHDVQVRWGGHPGPFYSP